MTKKEFKRRVKKLGLDPFEATVLFGYSHPNTFYNNNYPVSQAREKILILLEKGTKKTIREEIQKKSKKISAMREMVNAQMRVKLKTYRDQKKIKNS